MVGNTSENVDVADRFSDQNPRWAKISGRAWVTSIWVVGFLAIWILARL